MTSNTKASPRTENLEKNVPRHVAIIMDGNGRWAIARGLDVSEGHHAGFENIRRVVNDFAKRGVEYLTLYAFSTENWDRPETEVNGILDLAIAVIANEAQELHANGVRIKHLGRVDRLSPELRDQLEQAVEMTAGNTGLTLGIAFDYGGRAEIVDAVKKVALEVKSGCLDVDDIDEDLFSKYLYTEGIPDPDLIIRTSGEERLSGFLSWQSAYSELYFTEVFWPAFRRIDFWRAIRVYQQRERRYGL